MMTLTWLVQGKEGTDLISYQPTKVYSHMLSKEREIITGSAGPLRGLISSSQDRRNIMPTYPLKDLPT